MVKKIAFGLSEGIIIEHGALKKIVDYLYSKINLSKHRFLILDNMQKLNFLQDNEHYLSPNYRGYNYFLLMITIDNIKYCVAIDRKKLSYHKEQIDIKNISVIQINPTISDTFYQGTIFDGKLIKNNNDYIFLIQDCFYLMGNKILDMEMKQKINHLDNIFKVHFTKSSKYCANFNFKLNKLYEYSELKDFVYNILPTLSIPVNGITFFPKFSGINIVHIEKKNDKVTINNTNSIPKIDSPSYHIIHEFVSFLKNRNYSYETGKIKELWLTRTQIPDVYDVSENDNSDKIGIAHIPNLKISHYCDNNIKDKPIKFKCVYCNKFKKWIPITLFSENGVI
jgi:hypothetical protein